MTAIFTFPMDATVVSSSTISSGAVAANCLVDDAGYTWRSTGTTTNIIVDLGSAREFDTVAVCNTNLTAASRVRFTAGATTATTDYSSVAYQNVNVGTFIGTPTHIFKVNPITYRYVRILIDNATAALPYTEVGRLVIGKSLAFEGIDAEAEFGFKSFSERREHRRGVSFLRSHKVPTLKMKIGMVTEVQFRDEWQPLLYYAGEDRGLLFSLDLESGHQHERMFGTITSMAKSKHRIYDDHRIEMELEALRY